MPDSRIPKARRRAKQAEATREKSRKAKQPKPPGRLVHVTLLAMGQNLSFHRIPPELFDLLPGKGTGSLADGTRTKVIRRDGRRLVFHSKPKRPAGAHR